jgi:hypothetical protein
MIQGAISSVVEEVKKWNSAFYESEEQVAKLGQVIHSTGADLWTTADQMTQYATRMEKATKYSDEQIIEAQSVLLGFRSITGETFDRTMTALMDMTAVMGGDLAGAANILGKAIDTPVQGMSALSKQGFVFTEQEKELVRQLEEAGNHLEAQQYIIEAVEGAFQGAAGAISDAASATNALKDARERFEEARGASNAEWFAGWDMSSASSLNAEAAWLEQRMSAEEAVKFIEQYPTVLATAIERFNALKKEVNSSTEATDEQREGLIRLQGEIDSLSVQHAQAELAILLNQFKIAYQQEYSWAHDTAILNITEALDEINIKGASAYSTLNDLISGDLASGNTDMSDLSALLTQIQSAENVLNVFQGALKKTQGNASAFTQQQTKMNRELQNLESVVRSIDGIVSKTNAQIEGLRQQRADDYIENEEMLEGISKAYGNAYESLLQYREQLRAVAATDPKSIAEKEKELAEVDAAIANMLAGWRQYRVVKEDAKDVLDVEKELKALQDQYANDMAILNRLLQENLITQEQFYEESEGVTKNLQDGLRNLISLAQAAGVSYETLLPLLGEANGLMTEFENHRLFEEQQQKDMDDWQASLDEQSAKIDELIAKRDELSATVDQYGESWESAFNRERSATMSLFDELDKQGIQYGDLKERAEEYFDTLVEEKYAQDEIEATNQLLREQAELERERQKAFREAMSDAQRAFRFVQDITNELTNFAMNALSSYLEKEQQALDEEYEMYEENMERRYEALNEELEAELANKLYYLGLEEAQTEEAYEAQLEKARASGNEHDILAAESALTRYNVEQEYAQKQKELEEQRAAEQKELERKKKNDEAELTYKAQMAEWANSLLQIQLAGAQAVMSGIASTPYYVWPAVITMAGILTGLQTTLAMASMPKKQTFAYGGIVEGDRYRGDSVPILARGGEMMLTADDQYRLLELIRNGGGNTSQRIEIPVNIDGREVTRVVVNNINDRQYVIKKGSVV